MKRAIAVVIGCVWLASSARAQNALGDGSAFAVRPVGVGAGSPIGYADALATQMRFHRSLNAGFDTSGLAFRLYTPLRYGDYTTPITPEALYNLRQNLYYTGVSRSNLRNTAAVQYGPSPSGSWRLPGSLAGSWLKPGARPSVSGIAWDPIASLTPSAVSGGATSGPAGGSFSAATRVLRSPTAQMDSRAPDWTPVSRWPDETSSMDGGSAFDPAFTNGPAGAGSAGSAFGPHGELLGRLQAFDSGPTPAANGAVPVWEQRLREIRDALRTASSEVIRPAWGGQAIGEGTVRMLRDAPGVISSLAPPATERSDADSYTESMRLGQEFLAENRYFDAEEQFARAAMDRPGDPMAAIGCVHAQIGAGVYLSAAANLRAVLREHPELVGARYDPGLLPQDDRLTTVMAQLRKRSRGDDPPAADMAFLLAYLGFHLEDEVALSEGLEVLARLDPDGRNPLVTLLRGVWFDGSRPPDP